MTTFTPTQVAELRRKIEEMFPANVPAAHSTYNQYWDEERAEEEEPAS